MVLGMTDEPIPGGLTCAELEAFVKWNKSLNHDPHDVRRSWVAYVRRWRAGGGQMPPERRSQPGTHDDRYREIEE